MSEVPKNSNPGITTEQLIDSKYSRGAAIVLLLTLAGATAGFLAIPDSNSYSPYNTVDTSGSDETDDSDPNSP